jgi:hypothetical protein
MPIAGLRETSRRLRELEDQIAEKRRLIAGLAGEAADSERACLGRLLAELERVLRGSQLTLARLDAPQLSVNA